MLAQDETHLDLLARIRSCWMSHGIRHRVLTPGTNLRRTLHGAINLTTGAWHHHVSVRNVSVVFCNFLDLLLAAYPTAPVVAVICDNGGTHHSKITRRWLAEHPRLLLIEGVRYSPQNNPVERIWAALKQHIANTAQAPWPTGYAKPTRTFATAATTRTSPLQHPGHHHGYPRVTDNTYGQALRSERSEGRRF